MRRLLLFFIAAVTLLPAFAVFEITPEAVENVLHDLDDSLAKRERFISRRQRQINVLVDSLNRTGINEPLLLEIVDKYTGFNNDSALHFLRIGIESAECSDKIPFALRRAMLLPLNGFFGEAIESFDTIHVENVTHDLLPLYYDHGRQMYSYMAGFVGLDSATHEMYVSISIDFQKRLLETLPHESLEYKCHLGEYFMRIGEKGKARAMLEYVMEHTGNDDHLRALAAYYLSTMALDAGDSNAYIYYLGLSAIVDLSTATREVASLQTLGNYLYTLGDVDRSYKYLTEALTNAVECAAPMRMIESSRTLPIIEHAKQDQLNKKTRTIFMILGILVIVVIVLALTMVVLNREMKHMRILQENLRRANRVKEVYISQFLNLCSIYMDKLNQFCKIANRKITAGKVDDLYRLTKSGKFVEEQSKEFYEVFDNAFLHIYPHFVEQVNNLLREDARIELREGELLNTDLRILAFMRLGIEESSRIAQVLNYSLNTIYAYRNRTKARAINRDTFEEDVMKIAPDY